MPRPTRGPADALPVRGCHPLRRAVPDASGSRRQATGLVRVRSPLLTESRLMSFPPGTEMFQFPGFASPPYGFRRRYPRRGGLPHSEIRGSQGARASPRLIAACHVLHRLSVPRHPPDALKTLDLSLTEPRARAQGQGPDARTNAPSASRPDQKSGIGNLGSEGIAAGGQPCPRACACRVLRIRSAAVTRTRTPGQAGARRRMPTAGDPRAADRRLRPSSSRVTTSSPCPGTVGPARGCRRRP